MKKKTVFIFGIWLALGIFLYTTFQAHTDTFNRKALILGAESADEAFPNTTRNIRVIRNGRDGVGADVVLGSSGTPLSLAVASWSYIWNGTTFDRVRSPTADAVTSIGVVSTGTMLLNTGGGFDRLRAMEASDGIAFTGLPLGGNVIFNGTTWDRRRSVTADHVLVGIPSSGMLLTSGLTNDWVRARSAAGDGQAGDTILAASSNLWTGTGIVLNRAQAASVPNLGATTSEGVTLTAPASTWSETDSPAAATQAIASKAAGAAGVAHVSTLVHACFTDSDTLDVVTLNLCDGATGAGTVLWTAILALPVADDSKCISVPITFLGTAATAMTLEFTGAGTANSTQTVTLTGYSVDS